MPVFGIALFGLSQFTMTTTLKDIRQRVGLSGFCNDTIVSAATSAGTTTTLVDTSLKQNNDYFNGSAIVILTGTNAGSVRYVTDWDQTTSTFTLDRAVTATIATSVQFEVHSKFHPYDKNNAINEAIRAGAMRWARRIEDTSLTFSTNTYTYALDSLVVQMDPYIGLDYVMYDSGTSGTGTPYLMVDDDGWTIRTSSSTNTLQVLNVPRDGATMRLLYRVRPAQLSADTDLLTPQEESFYNYVCSKAAAILFRARAGVEPESEWTNRANAMEQSAEVFFSVDKPQTQTGKVRFPGWGKESRNVDYYPSDYGLT